MNIKKYIALYKTFTSCYCRSIHETVYFNATGLHHLLYQRRRPRSVREKIYRASLIPYIIDVVENASRTTYVLQDNAQDLHIWSLEKEIYIGDRLCIVKVILQKKGNGKVIFLSVMRKQMRKKAH